MKSIEMEKEEEETKGGSSNSSSISMVEAKLPPGFRFHPRDDELVCDYLMRRTAGSRYHHPIVLIEVDLNKCEPWDIPQWAKVGGKEWYFYSQKDRKYATGQRTNRATGSGYWKATGKDRGIYRKGRVVGMRKTLVFYQGRAPKGRKTDWVMHEFRLQHSPPPPPPPLKEEWVLCRVFHKKSERENIRSCSDETQSACLTPLMDSYIKFDQQPSSFPNDDHHPHIITNQQVPCFSFLSHNQTNLSTLHNPSLLTASSDQMVLRALLSQLTNSTKESQSCGEGSSESHLTDVGIPNTVWNY